MHPQPGCSWAVSRAPRSSPHPGAKIKFLQLGVRCAVGMQGGSPLPAAPPAGGHRAWDTRPAPSPALAGIWPLSPGPCGDLGPAGCRRRETEEAGTTPPARPPPRPSRARMLSENREFFLREPEARTEWGQLDGGRRGPHHGLAGAAAAGRVPPQLPGRLRAGVRRQQSGPALEGRCRTGGGGVNPWGAGRVLHPPRGLLAG